MNTVNKVNSHAVEQHAGLTTQWSYTPNKQAAKCRNELEVLQTRSA